MNLSKSGSIKGHKKENVDLKNLITSRDLTVKRHERLHKRQADSLTKQASAIKGLKAKVHRLQAVALRNLIVQVFFGIINAKIMQIVPNANLILEKQPMQISEI